MFIVAAGNLGPYIFYVSLFQKVLYSAYAALFNISNVGITYKYL